MFRAIRRLRRPLGVLLLAMLVSPGLVAECRPPDVDSEAGMPCCHEQPSEASLDAECCAVNQPAPSSENPPATVPQARTVNGKELPAATASAALDVAPPPIGVGARSVVAQRIPQDRLYLRNSAIRR